MKTDTLSRKDIFSLLLGLFFFIASFLLSYTLPEKPSEAGALSRNGLIMLGILFMAAIFWVTEPIPLAATALLVMVLQIITGVSHSESVFASFGNRAVFFLVGALMLAAAIQKHGVHKRVALRFLTHFGSSPTQMTLGIFSLSLILPFIMPEHAVVALLLPILLHLLLALEVEPLKSNFGRVCMLSMAYGATIGSLGTLMGGARNPLTIAFLKETSGKDIGFLDWMVVSLPVVLITAPLVWLILIKFYPPEPLDLSKARKALKKEVEEIGPLSRNEIKVLSILFFTIFLWIFFSSSFNVEVVALIGAVLLFVFKIVDWKDIESEMQWGILLLYGGAITLGVNLEKTGAALWLSNKILEFTGYNDYLLILVLILLSIFITQIMSNTAAVAMLLPIGYSFTLNTNLTVELTSFLIGLSGGLAFMFVIATPGYTIAYTAGYFSTKELFKAGFVANVVSIVVIFLVALTYWKLIGVW